MKLLLFPLTLIFFLLTELRIFFYRLNIFKSYKLPVKVISIGNLSFGGTGKTPFVIAICELLQTKFSHIVVISRGYKRQSKGAKVVSLRGDLKLSVTESGDEPQLIAKLCPNISMVVAENRIEGFKLIENEKPDLVILDDGFQHHRVQRDLDILLTSGYDPFWNDHLFPVGRLRESRKNWKRADMVCLTKKDDPLKLKYSAIYCPYGLYNFSKPIDKHNTYSLVTGIVDTKPILSYLESEKIKIGKHIHLRDHAQLELFEVHIDRNDYVIVTEKDMVKIDGNKFKNLTVISSKIILPSELSELILTKLM